MVKRWLILLAAGTLWAGAGSEIPADCLACHATTAPPLSLVYRRYLMLYSSKPRIVERMSRFLVRPGKKISSMPEGMKNRFNPELHPAYDPQTAEKAAEAVVEKEDVLKKIVVETSK